jgi:hypothetical protein
MNMRCLFFYLSGVIFLILPGCASPGIHENTLPVQFNKSGQGFPVGYEVQAIVHIFRGSIREDYVLAMSTETGAFTAAVLTPQGIPVYSVRGFNGQLAVSRQTAIGELLSPTELLGYLEFIYLEDSIIVKKIRNTWRWDTSKGARNFYPAGTPSSATAAIHIRYRGIAPWFSRIDLTDKRTNTRLQLELVEASRVLPE